MTISGSAEALGVARQHIRWLRGQGVRQPWRIGRALGPPFYTPSWQDATRALAVAWELWCRDAPAGAPTPRAPTEKEAA